MDGMGWDGMDGIGSPGGRGYRAPYGANKVEEYRIQGKVMI